MAEPRRASRLVGGLCLTVDLILLAAFASALVIVFSGGRTFMAFGTVIRAHQVGGLLGVGILLLSLRLMLCPRTPLLSLSSFPIERASATLLSRGAAFLSGANSSMALRIVLGTAAIALLLKVYSAYAHVGFLTGDDVEIHEMTFAKLFGRDWFIWRLRSPFFPLTFIYPPQLAAWLLGFRSPWQLILTGRLVVAVLSSVAVVVWYLSLRRSYGVPIAVPAAMFLATSKLQLIYGSSELPGPVATLLLVSAFGVLQQRGLTGVTAAALALGVAAALRFSEAVFFLPAVCQLLLARRVRDAVVVVGVGAVTAAGIQATSDYLYWGSAFASLREIVRFTLVERISSRGYEPVWFYLTSVGDWSDLVLIALAVCGLWVGDSRARLWGLLPLIVLSLFPHKEPRYLTPAIPFLYLLAALGLWRALAALPGLLSRKPRFANLNVVAICGLTSVFLIEGSAIHFSRSDAEVRLARRLANEPAIGSIAIEQIWRYGGHLYFTRGQRLVDLYSDHLPDSAYLPDAIIRDRVDVVVLDRDDASRYGGDQALSPLGYRRVSTPVADDARAVVFSRVTLSEAFVARRDGGSGR